MSRAFAVNLPVAPQQAPAPRTSLVSAFRVAGVGASGGLLLGRVVRGTLPDLIGLKTGDELVSLNGFKLGDPAQALEAYARLRYANHLHLSVERGGHSTEIHYFVR